MRRDLRGALGLAIFLGALLVGCGGSSATETPTPPPSLSSAEQGEQLYLTKGCSGCHGLSAEGSDIAPALPGHSADQVRRQVRNPQGLMPAFGPDQLSDRELDLLVAYVESLDAEGSHSEPTALPLDEAVAMHHWMALTALTAEDAVQATHHVGHAIELLEDEEHRQGMEAVLASLEAGALHDAEHEIEEMLAGIAEPALSMAELHLQLTLSAVLVHDAPDATHHLQHFARDADESEREIAEKVLEHIDVGNEEQAEHAIIELLESMGHEQHHHE